MADREEFIFKINAYSPETIPMGRLAEYMVDLARLLGEEASVHFVRLAEGSTQIVHAIEHEAVPKVTHRIDAIRSGSAPSDLLKIAVEINRKLANDNADGSLTNERGAQIIEFPGALQIKVVSYGPVTQQGAIDGIVRRVGGKATPVPVMLQTRDGFETHCFATREMSKELAKHYDALPIRCFGRGTWKRDDTGHWILERFVISNFEMLDSRSLPELLTELQAIPGAGWKNDPNVWTTLQEIRGDDEPDE